MDIDGFQRTFRHPVRWDTGFRCIVGVMKMGNTAPREGLEPTSLAFRASVLPLHQVGFPDVITILTPTCLYRSLPQRSVQTTTGVRF